MILAFLLQTGQAPYKAYMTPATLGEAALAVVVILPAMGVFGGVVAHLWDRYVDQSSAPSPRS
jgi:hypothetical protein